MTFHLKMQYTEKKNQQLTRHQELTIIHSNVLKYVFLFSSCVCEHTHTVILLPIYSLTLLLQHYFMNIFPF